MTQIKTTLGNYQHKQILDNTNVFGKWIVTKEGDLDYNNGRYFIDHKRLNEKDWLSHIQEKGWIDLNDFIPAFWAACKVVGIKQLSIIIY